MASDSTKAPRRYPLQSLGLANFKAFGSTEQIIRIRPITLIFGPNSGGKSSLLHFLLWMKDVVNGKGLDIYHPSAGGASVDLGGFKQIRHGNNPETPVQVKLQLKVKDGRGRDRQLETISTFAACEPPADYTRRLRAMVAERFADVLTRNPLEKLLAYSPAMETAIVRHPLKQLLSSDHGEFTVELRLDDCWEEEGQLTTPLNELRSAHCPKLDDLYTKTAYGDLLESATIKDEEYKPPSKEELSWELQELAVAALHTLNLPPPQARALTKPALSKFEISEDGESMLRAERSKDAPLALHHCDAAWLKGFDRGQADGDSRFFTEDKITITAKTLMFGGSDTWLPEEVLFAQQVEPYLHGIQEKIKELLDGTPELPGVLRQCGAAAREEYDNVSYLGPLRAYPARGMTVSELPMEMDAEGLYAWRLLYERGDVRAALSEWLAPPRVFPGYEILLDHRVDLNRALACLDDALMSRVTLMQNNLSHLFELNKRPGPEGDSRDALNEAFETLTGHKLVESMREALERTKVELAVQSSGVVYLKDRRTGKLVTSRDIGVGISQLIPVFVYAKAAEGKVIAIEEPETHIHPALQAELGDVFIESALQQRNTFLIETHSEHLVLRILRRIRETTAGENGERPPLTPADVTVLYVEPGEAGSKVIEIPIGPDGDFDRPWPNGFFAERGKELF